MAEQTEQPPESERDIFDDARDVVEDSRRLADDVGRVYDQVKETGSLRDIYDRNPYAVLAAAAGAGYVLGGGLFTPFTKRIAKIGMKALVVPVALSKIKGITQAAAHAELGPDESEP